MGLTAADENQGGYMVECSKVKSFPSLTWKMQGKDFEVDAEHLFLSIGEQDGKDYCMFGIQADPSLDDPNHSYWLLGDVFLGQFYSVWDVAQQKIGFANSVAEPPDDDMYLFEEQEEEEVRLQTTTPGSPGNSPDGSSPDGNNPDGNNSDGSNSDGNNSDGNNSDGNNSDGNNPDGSSSDSPNGGEGEGAALRGRAVTPVHTAAYMCKEYGVQCKASARELKAVALAAKAAKRREQRVTKRSRAPPRRMEERQKK